MEHETGYAGDESSSENGSWSSYENLPPEDIHISEDGADSDNVDVDVHNEQNDLEESYADNMSQVEVGARNGHDDHDDDGESDMDIGHAEYQQEALDRHWKIMAMTFGSEAEAYVFYDNYAKECGFNIRKEKVERGKGPSGSIRFRQFVCSRSGKRQSKFLTMDGRSRGP